MEERKPKVHKKEIESHILLGTGTGPHKIITKVEQVTEGKTLEYIVEKGSAVLGCQCVSEPASVCKCGNSLCERHGQHLCYACGKVVGECCMIRSYTSDNIVYHKGWCRALSYFVRIWKG